MKSNGKRRDFIDRTARKPLGERAVKNYNDPKAHYRSFRIILEKLNLTAVNTYFEIGCGGGVMLKQAGFPIVNVCSRFGWTQVCFAQK
jgi:hypothetical protein